jgi:hypothetical protein
MLVNLVAPGGDRDAIKNRDTLAAKMTPNQIAGRAETGARVEAEAALVITEPSGT